MRAQRDLLVANGLFLRALIGPSLLLAVPFSFLVLGLHGAFARAPLQLEKPAILTRAMSLFEIPLPMPHLIAPDGIEVETPPLRLLTKRRSAGVCDRANRGRRLNHSFRHPPDHQVHFRRRQKSAVPLPGTSRLADRLSIGSF